MRCGLALTLGLLFSAPAAAAQSPCVDLALPAPDNPPLRGRITDAGSGEPLFPVFVLIDLAPVGMTDCDGEYAVLPFADGPHTITVNHRGYVSHTATVTFSKGITQRLDFALVAAPLPCCDLRGRWAIDLQLDSAAALGDPPSARAAKGSLVFADSLRLEWDRPSIPDSRFNSVNGRADIDLTPFFGGPLGPDISRSMFGPTDGDFLREATGTVFSSDSVAIDLIPRISHGGLSLQGRLRGDSVTGKWYQRAYCCGAFGRFTMRRLPL